MGSKIDTFLEKVDNEEITGSDLLLFVDAMQELANENDDVQELLDDIDEEGDEILLNFKITDSPIEASIEIKGGTLTTSYHCLDHALLKLLLDEKTAIDILSQRKGIVESYQEGKIEVEGNLMQVAGLAILLNILGDELGVL